MASTDHYKTLPSNLNHLRRPLSHQLSDCSGKPCRTHTPLTSAASTSMSITMKHFNSSLSRLKSYTESSIELWHLQNQAQNLNSNNTLNTNLQNQSHLNLSESSLRKVNHFFYDQRFHHSLPKNQKHRSPLISSNRHLPFPNLSLTNPETPAKTSPWRKIRSLVTSPFIQTYKRQKYPWIQLAGHQGNFMAGHCQGTILKRLSGNEKSCFEKLMSDVHMKEFVPQYKETITNAAGEVYLELEDLLAQFTNPSIMDIKMGLRTYLEEELIKAGEKPKLRKDMYEKMVAIDPEEPKPEEHSLKAVTKPRYMIWRESISSTSTLGFRIDGVKLRSNGENNNCSRMVKHDFKRTKTEESVRTSIELFADKDQQTLCKYYNCLKKIRKSLLQSEFFREYEMIGSSLLFVHDDQNASVWMIDFAKTYPLPAGVEISHLSPWTLGNHEDGYLVGLDNLIRIFGQLCDNVRRADKPVSLLNDHNNHTSTDSVPNILQGTHHGSNLRHCEIDV